SVRNLRPLSSRLPTSKPFSSPPTSDSSDDDTTSHTTANTPSNTLFNTCRALHSILSSTSSPHILTPPKRSTHKPSATTILEPAVQLRITKPKPPPARGPNKRRRMLEDEDDDSDKGTATKRARNIAEKPFVTPMRLRPGPSMLPRGL